MNENFWDPEGEEPACIPWDRYDLQDEGRRALLANRDHHTNPYPHGSPEYFHWQTGFDRAWKLHRRQCFIEEVDIYGCP